MRLAPISRLWPLLGVAVLAVGFSPQAEALPAVQNVLGVYDGFYQSAMDPADQGPVQVMVTQQHQRRFMGALEFAAGAFPLDGTIAASGEFSIVGRGGGAKFEVHGEAQFMGDGSVRVQSAYRFRQLGGAGSRMRPDSGLLILLRDTAAADIPSVVGVWDGSYQSDVDPADVGRLSIVVDSQEGSSFGGAMTVDGFLFPVVGTVGQPPDPNSPYPFEAIGLGPAGWFQVIGEVVLSDDPAAPSEAMASYELFFADGRRDAGTFDVFR